MLNPNLSVLAYKSVATAVRWMPATAARNSARLFDSVAASWGQSQRAIVAKNLQRVDPTLRGQSLETAVTRAFGFYIRYWVESFQLPHLPAAVVAKGIRTDGYSTHVIDGLNAGNGVILALPHLGGWEWAGRWLTDLGHRVTVVVERLEPPALFEWFVDLRRDLGMEVVPLGDDAGRKVLAALRRNDIVCLLCDRDIGGTGLETTFFGETTTLPAGPATLALRSGAPLLATAVYHTDEPIGHFGLVRPPVSAARSGNGLRADIAAMTQQLAGELELLIRRDPSQWHLFQPNWPSDRAGQSGKVDQSKTVG